MTTFNTSDITCKNFTARANGWAKRQQTGAKELQSLITFAIWQYEESESGDTSFLTKIVHKVSESKTISSKAIQGYIMTICPNIRWTKLKDGSEGFKVRKKGLPVIVKGEDLNVPWYEHEVSKPAKASKDFDPAQSLVLFINKCQKAGIDPDEAIKQQWAVAKQLVNEKERKKVSA